MKKVFSYFALRQFFRISVLLYPLCMALPGQSHGQSANPTYSSYTGQSSLSGTESVRLLPGFHAPSGSTLRVFIAGGTTLGTGGTAGQNHVQRTVYLLPLSSPPSNPTTGQALRDITYYDGLGRPLQEVGVKASGGTGFKDVVTPVVYDGYGRQDKDYLPYATATGAGGAFKTGAVSAQGSYYSGSSTVPAGQSTTAYPSGPRKYEPSPLNRVVEQGFPGQAWQPASSRGTTGRTVVTGYATNNTLGLSSADTRRVVRYGASVASNGIATLTLNGVYGVGQLYVTVTKDENWESGRQHTSEEYTDKQGRVVLRRTFTTSSGAAGIASTYYVYNDLGQLSFVLPPGRDADFNPDSGTLPTAAMLNNFAYQYRYDKRGRLAYRRIPGRGWENFNYNPMGWVMMHQDARQSGETFAGFGPGKYHRFYKYDAHGRVILTGVERNRVWDREQIQNHIDTQPPYWEERVSSGGYHGYSNVSQPQGVDDMYLLEAHYYDRYDNIPGLPHNASGSYSGLTQGRLVASKAKVIGTAETYVWTVYYYDDKGNVVREWKQHYLGGSTNANKFDDTANEYNFAGQLTKSTRKHHTTSAATPNVTITTEYEYDHRQRLTHTWKRVNTGTRTLLARNTYNEVGQVRTKQLHSTNGGTSWGQAITYGYNERGWVKESNSPLFKQVLGYNAGSAPQYNGNISSQQFTRHNVASTPALVTDTYSYTYDGMNRLTQGTMAGNKGRETITYDESGNIRTLTRTATGSTVVDNLAYTYAGNRLSRVVDATTTTDVNYQLPGTTDYTYDANGNLKTRKNTNTASTHNKNNITATTYNYLDLPQSITATAGNVTYVYDGAGRKLRSTNGIVGQTRDYIDGIEYVGGTMELIHTEEGRITRSGSTYTYHYFLKDHLGNNRVGFSQGTNVTAPDFTADYYPFGLQYRQYVRVGNPKINYLYNGKELQDGLKQYDYGARLYDPVIGRWGRVDPLAENHFNLTPYNYVMNNPMSYIDLFGLDTLKANNITPETWQTFDTKNDVIEIGEVEVTASKSNGSEWKDITGNALTAFGASNKVKEELLDFTIRNNFKSNSTRQGWEQLARNQQIWRQKRTLGKAGSKYLKGVKVVNKLTGVAGVAIGLYDSGVDFKDGRYYAAGSRMTVMGIAAGSAFIPVVGWGVSVGIGVADAVWGEEFYNYVEDTFGNE